MSKASRNIITIAIITFFVAIAVIYSVIHTRSIIIPDGTVGANAGNLNNNGLFCETNDVVYFSNSYDEGALYSMTPSQTDVKKVYNMKARYINAPADYLIFYGDTISESKGLGSVVSKPGIFMMSNKGTNLRTLTRDINGSLISYGNAVFYQKTKEGVGPTLCYYDIKSGESTEVFNYQVNPNCIVGNTMYFSGTSTDHHLFAFSIDTNSLNDIWGGDIWNPIVSGNYVYYMDVKNNYRLCRYSLLEGVIEILTSERTDCFNVYNDIIYYQVSSKSYPCLKRVNTDGSGNEVVIDGIYNNINITSKYVYFQQYGDNYTTYCTPTYGLSNVTEFTAAKDSVKTGK